MGVIFALFCVHVYFYMIYMYTYIGHIHVHIHAYTYTHVYTYMCISLFFKKLTKLNQSGRHLQIAKEGRNNLTIYNPWFEKNDFHKKEIF